MKLFLIIIFFLFSYGCTSLKVLHNSKQDDYSKNVIRISKEHTLNVDRFIHEYAHFLQDNYIKSSSEIEFKAEIDKILQTDFWILKSKFLEDFSEEEAIDLQDIINAVTKGAVKIKYGHEDTHWSFYGNVYKEVFADLFVIYYNDKEKEMKFINKNFKGIKEAFGKLIVNNRIDCCIINFQKSNIEE